MSLRLQLVLFLLFSISAIGCGNSDRPSLANASGKVTLDGQPVAQATVTFVPVDGGRPSTAITDAQGQYTMNSFDDAQGAIVGDHNVSVMKIDGPGAQLPEQADDPTAGGGDESATGENSLSPAIGEADGRQSQSDSDQINYLVPAKYMDATTSGLKISVPASGSDSLDIVLQQ